VVEERRPLPSEDKYLLGEFGRTSSWRYGREDNDDQIDWVRLLIVISIVLALVFIALPLVQAAIVDPGVRWFLLFVVFILCAIILLARVYPRQDTEKPFFHEIAERRKELDSLEERINQLDRALAGEPFSQMIAYQDLRDLLVRRLMLNKHLSRIEVENVLGDRGWLRRDVKDQDLIWLLLTDFNEEYDPAFISDANSQEVVRSFRTVFPIILKKVERLR